MEQNKIRTYILYAIGEILLVVIGILIALQVNNWNEERKLQTVSDNTLSELRMEIVENKRKLAAETSRIRDITDHRSEYLNNPDETLTDPEKIEAIYDLIFTYSDPVKMPTLDNELGSAKKIIQWGELSDGMLDLQASIDFYNKGLEYIENDWNLNLAPFMIRQGLLIEIMAVTGELDPVDIDNANVYESEELRNLIANGTLMTKSLLRAAQRISDDYDRLLTIIDERV